MDLILLWFNVLYSLIEIPRDPQLRLSTCFIGRIRYSTDDQILATCQDLRCDLKRINT